MTMTHEDVSKWASQIDTVISNTPGCCVSRVVVVNSTASTMDSALTFSGNQSGLLLVASEQTNGRGQFGRTWHDAPFQTLPCTFALDSKLISTSLLSPLIACAVHQTIDTLTPNSANIRIKWPNDIVVRTEDGDRKLAGVLIEQRNGLTLVGIGINCTQQHADWNDEIRVRAESLSNVGAQVSRLEILCHLIGHLTHWINGHDAKMIRGYFDLHDAMIGTVRTFKYNNDCYHGVVEHIDPLEAIVIQTPSGRHTLPISQTKHVPGDEPCQCNKSN